MIRNKSVLVIIPAFSGDQALPDQHVRKLNGVSLVQIAISLSKQMVEDNNILLITDIDEVELIASRNGVSTIRSAEIDLSSNFLKIFAKKIQYFIFLWPNTPLIKKSDVLQALKQFETRPENVLVTKKDELIKLHHNCTIQDLFKESKSKSIIRDIKSFIIIKAGSILRKNRTEFFYEYNLGNNAVEILNYQDWWICEKFQKRKRIVFVVAGNADIGMGHIYRSLTLAHEIHDHEIIFLCTKESELALKKIAEKFYETIFQKENLIDEVLKLNPDLVINDFLDTGEEYIKLLKLNDVKVVNFEDLSNGALLSDLTFNELFDKPLFSSKNTFWGHKYLFLRDEFNGAKRHEYLIKVKTIMITFGGTDPQNYTINVLNTIYEYCILKGINIIVVAGPGYSHKIELAEYLKTKKNITFTWATNIMSQVMEKAQLAISSNGRTIYELSHMNIPSIIVSQNQRETLHHFSNIKNGFINLGILKSQMDYNILLDTLKKLVENNTFRKNQIQKMKKQNFLLNKQRVVKMILKHLN